MRQPGAEKQFEKHLRENELLIYKICRLYTHTDTERQDLFQEVVIQLWKAFPDFKGRSKFSTWLYRVALNTAITGLRKQKNFIDTYEPATLPQRIDENTSIEDEERLSQLYKSIEKLNKVEKAIVMLYMEEKSYDEMEDILGITQGNLRVKMSRIKEKLRQLAKTT